MQEGRLTWFLKNDLDFGLERGEGEGVPVLGNKVTSPETWKWHGHSLFILFSFCIELWYLTWSYEKARIWLSWSVELAGVDWGQWQRWGLKVFGGQRSECATANPRAKPSAKVAWGCSLLLEGWRSSGQHSKDPTSGKNSPSEPRLLVWMPGKRTEKGIYRDRERSSPSPQELWGMFAPNTLHGTPASRSFGDWSEQRQLSN